MSRLDKDLRARPTRMFTFASGGWVLLLTAFFGVVIVLMVLMPALERARNRPPGDGATPASYGFALEPALVEPGELTAGQLHRDLIAPLVAPPVMDGAAVDAFNAEMRGKFLVPDDRVIGVALGGDSRAYPLTMMGLHQVANDSLGGRSIAVTYDPLCDAMVVVDRALDGVPVEFGVSGLLQDSNVVLYDRVASGGTESLWRQLDAVAITGPAAAAGRRLAILPAEIATWSDWLARHPDTTVLVPGDEMMPRYKETSFARYHRSAELLFPVDPEPPADGPAAKTPCVMVCTDGTRGADGPHRLYAIPDLVAAATDGLFEDEIDGVRVVLRVSDIPITVRLEAADGAPGPVLVTGFWFAWHAQHPALPLAPRAAR